MESFKGNHYSLSELEIKFHDLKETNVLFLNLKQGSPVPHFSLGIMFILLWVAIHCCDASECHFNITLVLVVLFWRGYGCLYNTDFVKFSWGI